MRDAGTSAPDRCRASSSGWRISAFARSSRIGSEFPENPDSRKSVSAALPCLQHNLMDPPRRHMDSFRQSIRTDAHRLQEFSTIISPSHHSSRDHQRFQHHWHFLPARQTDTLVHGSRRLYCPRLSPCPSLKAGCHGVTSRTEKHITHGIHRLIFRGNQRIRERNYRIP